MSSIRSVIYAGDNGSLFIQNRQRPTNLTHFEDLHEVARHTTHSTETTEVAAGTIALMVQQCERLVERSNSHSDALYDHLDTLRFQHSLMRGISARAVSNEKRLSSEITLVLPILHAVHALQYRSSRLTSISGLQHDGPERQPDQPRYAKSGKSRQCNHEDHSHSDFDVPACHVRCGKSSPDFRL